MSRAVVRFVTAAVALFSVSDRSFISPGEVDHLKLLMIDKSGTYFGIAGAYQWYRMRRLGLVAPRLLRTMYER